MKQYIVDAFADRVFAGNQAAVCVMDEWPEVDLMKQIAKENNFSETAFAVKEGNVYHLRWFTPGDEVDFCGHATLGTSFVLFSFYEKEAEEIVFKTQVGTLSVRRNGDLFEMNFPAYRTEKIEVTDEKAEAIG
ncbi:MAG: PhzF family phenazine biosynthesis isomerase, partial [Erysipelotrichaceae bacterium]|nr:PhzF family phenazine biosynthesis isomerase [Erysipelotrichaceae bacterium]